MNNDQTKAEGSSPSLHIMYFVDTASTRSLTIRLWVIRLAAFLAVGFVLFSMASATLVVLLYRHTNLTQQSMKELKAAHLAQSVVHENLLREAPFLVVSGEGELLHRGVKQVATALLEKRNIAFSAEELSFAARANTPSSDGQEASDPAQAADVEEAGQMEPRVAISRIKSRFNKKDESLSVSFNIKNMAHFGTKLSGTVCAVMFVKNAKGERVEIPYPSDFERHPDGPLHCNSGLEVRFARHKPTQLTIRTKEVTLEELTVYFTDESGTTEHHFNLNK